MPEPLRAEWRSLYAEMEALATPEARLYKALDKLEAVIQHNEADIAHVAAALNTTSTSPTVPTRWRGTATCDGSKRAANEISRQKIAAAKEQAPDERRGNSRSSPTGCAALCAQFAESQQKLYVLAGIRLHECASEPFRTFSLAFSCKQRVYHLLAPKGGAKSIRQAKPPGTTVVCA